MIKRLLSLYLPFAFCLFLGITSCDQDAPDKEQLIAEAIAVKEKEYRATEYEKCLSSYRNEAETEIDSILRIRAKTGKIDTLSPPLVLPGPNVRISLSGNFRNPNLWRSNLTPFLTDQTNPFSIFFMARAWKFVQITA